MMNPTFKNLWAVKKLLLTTEWNMAEDLITKIISKNNNKIETEWENKWKPIKENVKEKTTSAKKNWENKKKNRISSKQS